MTKNIDAYILDFRVIESYDSRQRPFRVEVIAELGSQRETVRADVIDLVVPITHAPSDPPSAVLCRCRHHG